MEPGEQATKLREIANDLELLSIPKAEQYETYLRNLADTIEGQEEALGQLRAELEAEEEEAIRFRDERNVLRRAMWHVRRRATRPWRKGDYWQRVQWAADIADAVAICGDPASADAALSKLLDDAVDPDRSSPGTTGEEDWAATFERVREGKGTPGEIRAMMRFQDDLINGLRTELDRSNSAALEGAVREALAYIDGCDYESAAP
jgi:hypothetical protein